MDSPITTIPKGRMAEESLAAMSMATAVWPVTMTFSKPNRFSRPGAASRISLTSLVVAGSA